MDENKYLQIAGLTYWKYLKMEYLIVQLFNYNSSPINVKNVFSYIYPFSALQISHSRKHLPRMNFLSSLSSSEESSGLQLLLWPQLILGRVEDTTVYN